MFIRVGESFNQVDFWLSTLVHLPCRVLINHFDSIRCISVSYALWFFLINMLFIALNGSLLFDSVYTATFILYSSKDLVCHCESVYHFGLLFLNGSFHEDDVNIQFRFFCYITG